MKNPANQLICLSIVLGISLSCNNRSIDNQNLNDSIANENRSGSSPEGLPDNDSVLNFRDGVNVNDGREVLDTIQLPNPILEAIEKDNLLKSAEIVDKIKREENGVTVYEVVFYPVNGKEEKVIFDAEGRRKSKP